jgi:molybdenum cofactor cytidylyltransferase
MSKNLSAVVVASRTHRHLKNPVSLLPFGDSTVLGRTLHAYLGGGFSEVLVVISYRAAEVEASLQPLAGRIRVVASPHPDEDFAGLVRRGLEQVSSSSKGIALGLGNQPLLEEELVRDLAAAFVTRKARLMVPVWQGLLGYPIFFDPALAGDFRNLGARGETWDVIKRHAADVTDHQVQYTSVVRYVEDMEDYQELLGLAGLPVPSSAVQEFGETQPA